MKASVAVAKEADAKKGFSPTGSDNSIHRVRDEPERQLGSLRGVIDNIRRDGGKPSVESIATQLSGMRTGERTSVLLALQHTHGNRYVQRVVSGIQAKLTIGQPNDIYEQEADRVAADVVRHISVPQSQDVQIFRFPEERERRLTRSPITEKKPITAVQQPSYGVGASIPPRIGEVMRGAREGGQNLPGSMREPLEHAIGADFRGVRVHVDAESDQVNRLLHARAFTTGQDIFFRRGEYQPRSRQGQELLAHELVHVLQQSGAGPQTEFVQLSPAEDFESALYLETEDARVLALLSAIRCIQLADLQEALEIERSLRTSRGTYCDLAYLFQLGLDQGAQEQVLQALSERGLTLPTETPSQEVVEERAASHVREAFQQYTRARERERQEQELRELMAYVREEREYPLGGEPTETPSQEVVEERAASHVREQQSRAREQERPEQELRELMAYVREEREYLPGEEPTETLENELSGVIQLTPLPDSQRVTHKTNIIAEMCIVHTDFDLGAVQAERDIAAAASANANVAKAIFSVGMALIVPGVGGLVAGVATRFGVTLAQATASTIGSAIGDAAKSAGNTAIDNAFSRRRGFFSRITSGFEEAQRIEREWIVTNVQNRGALPDAVLTDLARYWRQLARGNESGDWAIWFREQWVRYERQVLAIQPPRRPSVVGPPEHIREVQTGLVWAEHPNGTEYLVQITATTREIGGRREPSRLAFQTFIDQDLRDLAIARAGRTQTGGRIQTVPWLHIIRIPSSVPPNAVQR